MSSSSTPAFHKVFHVPTPLRLVIGPAVVCVGVLALIRIASPQLDSVILLVLAIPMLLGFGIPVGLFAADWQTGELGQIIEHYAPKAYTTRLD